MATIKSTLPTSQKYSKWENKDGVFVETFSKTINGGHGIMNQFMQSPEGAVLTTVTVEELTELKGIELFQMHQKEGYIVVDGSILGISDSDNDMNKTSRSSPVKKSDIEKAGITVTIGDGEK